MEDKKETILIIDDELILLSLASHYFKSEGFDVTAVSSGEAGIEELKKREFDVVLTDLNMPGVPGKEVIVFAKKKYPDMPIIVFSGAANVERSIEALRIGAWDFITKPATMPEVRHIIDRAIDRAVYLKESKDYHEQLEKEVRERTQALEQVNLDLLREIADREKAQKELIEKQAQIAHTGRLASLGEMATGIAHEINQPLNIIQMCADLIEQEIQDEEIDREDILLTLKDLTTQVERAAQIIKSIRTFAREDSKPILVARNINHDIAEGIKFFAEQCRIHGIEIVTEFGDVPYVNLHMQKMQQVVINLLQNAQYALKKKESDYSEKKIITLRTYCSEDKKNVIFEIEDNGIGMDEETKERCLDPFFTTKPVDEGTGLGMSIMYGIIKEFGGDIEIESELGVGTIFRILLPVADNQE